MAGRRKRVISRDRAEEVEAAPAARSRPPLQEADSGAAKWSKAPGQGGDSRAAKLSKVSASSCKASASSSKASASLSKAPPQEALAPKGQDGSEDHPQPKGTPKTPVDESSSSKGTSTAAQVVCASLCSNAWKTCGFLCGSKIGETPDPVDPTGKSVRWAYELTAADAPENPRGGNDYWCGRAWVEFAAEAKEDDKVEFQKAIAKDHDKLKKFLQRRGTVISRAREKATREKRRGNIKKSVCTPNASTRQR